MSSTKELLFALNEGKMDAFLSTLYGKEKLALQKERYKKVLLTFTERYGEREQAFFFSVPGRSELIGNHTDHNGGKVMAAAISADVVALASPSDTPIVRVKSEGYKELLVDLQDLTEEHYPPCQSVSLLAGTLAAFRNAGYSLYGFDACTVSDVLKGSGLSSSAAFEVTLASIGNAFYAGGALSPLNIAQFAQYAENVFFKKPSGLMDQLTCAVGGIVFMDFKNDRKPLYLSVPFDFKKAGYSLCIVNTGGSHSNLTAQYGMIPAEMKKVAAFFSEKQLGNVSFEEFFSHEKEIRASCGDRAFLRAYHFFKENERVLQAKEALSEHDLQKFCSLLCASSDSSCKYLQNAYSVRTPDHQGIPVALLLSEEFLKNLTKPYSLRLHGGGFAGTVQAFLPENEVAPFIRKINHSFFENAAMELSIRSVGAVMLPF